ncbi:MAG TPA: hypothetical protein H9793_09910, partial [Candidatus Brevibacterium intestinigallinarum]|nr:hypothetical protein [Candidatus Brevibacterium intestinigallinarum]
TREAADRGAVPAGRTATERSTFGPRTEAAGTTAGGRAPQTEAAADGPATPRSTPSESATADGGPDEQGEGASGPADDGR